MKRLVSRILSFLGIQLLSKQFYYYIELYLFNNLCNKVVIRQNRDYKSIPIIIISFNQLYYLKQLIDFLLKNNYNNIVVIDNNSTYEPLLQYFDEMETAITIHRLKENHGHLVFWKVRELFEKYSKGYYAVTDADINPIAECPDDFLEYFKKILDKDFRITKVGFSLKIDDIPKTNLNRDKIIKWESKYWRKPRSKDGNFTAGIDTTFALYRPKYDYNDMILFLKGCRTKYPYMAKHGGWYVDSGKLTQEQKFYFENCNESSSWRVDNEGKIMKSEYNI